ncbi:hypothetical protein HAX54_041669, partial [Datura stramonium]|nr:hypothetical protein [Datura stramonium]
KRGPKDGLYRAPGMCIMQMAHLMRKGIPATVFRKHKIHQCPNEVPELKMFFEDTICIGCPDFQENTKYGDGAR